MQRNLQRFPFSVSEGNEGTLLIHVLYLEESRIFTPKKILGMIVCDLEQIAKDNGATSMDCLKTKCLDCLMHQAVVNFENTLFSIKRFIGLKMNEVDSVLQECVAGMYEQWWLEFAAEEISSMVPFRK
ncbi:hypothetical protein SUGI_0232360 [Cryptomeria japonica]|nr:hypothetical protein SUGI_0232360 [Cryptomeria japonica]